MSKIHKEQDAAESRAYSACRNHRDMSLPFIGGSRTSGKLVLQLCSSFELPVISAHVHHMKTTVSPNTA